MGKPPIGMLDGLRQQFDQTQNISPEEAAANLSLTQAVIYEDKRAHFVFSDKSAMILH